MIWIPFRPVTESADEAVQAQARYNSHVSAAMQHWRQFHGDVADISQRYSVRTADVRALYWLVSEKPSAVAEAADQIRSGKLSIRALAKREGYRIQRPKRPRGRGGSNPLKC